MFHVESNNYTVKFTFKHTKLDNLMEINHRFIHAVTQCDLTVNNENFTGIAACVVGDNFNKEIGRKIALTRAVQKAGLPKEVRADIWIAYFDRGAGERAA